MRMKRRLTAVCALAVTTALVAGGTAWAIDANSTATLAVSPSTGLGSAGKAAKLTIHTHTNYTGSGTKTLRARLFFDKNITFTPSTMPTCPTASVSGNITMKQAMTACKNALVGSGTAAANLATPGDIGGCVLVFNAKDASTAAGTQPGILLFTRLQIPGSINCANPATNQNGNGSILLQAPLATNPASTTPGGALPAAYYQGGKWLDFNNIPQTAPLSDFNVTVGKGAPGTNLTGTKANYIKAKCTSRSGLGTPAKKLVMRTIFKYTTGSPTEQAVNSKTAACS